jgi:hypothetical protein
MRDNSAPKAARYMTELHHEDGISEYLTELVSEDRDVKIKDEGATLWVYHTTLTDMIDLLSDLARNAAVHAYPHRRKDTYFSCDACGTVKQEKAVRWIHRWYDE